MVNGSNLLTLKLYHRLVPVQTSVKRPMRPSTSRAMPVQSRERRLREAGLSGARALTRLIVALIENLGAHDKAGQARAQGWPHGTTRTAFGPTPLGTEIERLMATPAPSSPAVHARDAITGLPFYVDDFAAPVPRGPAPEPARQAAHAPAARSAAVLPARVSRSGPTPPGPSMPSAPEEAFPATANIPMWQRPFIAAPGVRYMRTPDRLLRRNKTMDAPIAPLAAAEPIAASELPVDLDLVEDKTLHGALNEILFDAVDVDTDFMDEVELLSIEDLVALETRRGSPQRLRMMSGFAVDLPHPANDPVAVSLKAEIAPLAVPKQPFAISVRPKAPKPTPAPTSSAAAEASPSAMSARVTMAAAAAVPAKRRPVSVEWDYPSVELLAEARKPEGNALTADMLEQNARLLETTLEDFGIRGEIIHVRAGPVVTLYELEPAPGMKSSRVIGLADDIARSMSALSARVAVVPGRNAIGIELPNERRETVYFREMVESEAFNDSKHKLAIALGKTIGGEPVIAELAKMPHLLVAGTTGSGKSVAINTMILSLLYRLKPEECRLIMVDPKMLELSVYDGIPHLLTPVVTDPKKAVVALKWAVREMEDRYKKMSKLGVRNIDGFNARVSQAKAAGETIMMQVTTGFDKETGKPVHDEQAMDLTNLPYIVVIVDEMADLMMVAGKDIEGAIQRLAQMARAAGIHLIMATQRPSVDVITGTIKANFPTRISFQVTSKIDSRTILGEQGAEQLLGQGDMLHMQGGGRIYRVHGPFVSDDEVEKVVAHLKAQGQPDYLDSVTDDIDAEPAEDEDEATDGAVFDKTAMGGDDDGSLYDQAVKVVLRDKKSSVSYVQRRLSVGYNKAASLIERMEKDGILGPASHTGKREILAHSRGRVISGVPMGADED